MVLVLSVAIDSNLLNFFDETDRRYLEEVTAIVAKTLYY